MNTLSRESWWGHLSREPLEDQSREREPLETCASTVLHPCTAQALAKHYLDLSCSSVVDCLGLDALRELALEPYDDAAALERLEVDAFLRSSASRPASRPEAPPDGADQGHKRVLPLSPSQL